MNNLNSVNNEDDSETAATNQPVNPVINSVTNAVIVPQLAATASRPINPTFNQFANAASIASVNPAINQPRINNQPAINQQAVFLQGRSFYTSRRKRNIQTGVIKNSMPDHY